MRALVMCGWEVGWCEEDGASLPSPLNEYVFLTLHLRVPFRQRRESSFLVLR